MRTTLRLVTLTLVAALLGETAAFGAKTTGDRSRGLEPLDIKGEPTPADWRYFVKSSEADRERLWGYHTGRGVALGGWAWGWRLGWVRTCGQSVRAYCQELLRQALFDRALVVRAEAATRIGRLYEGTGSLDAVTLLKRAYANPRNARHGKPLFVQSRILFALRRVGGPEALATGAALAAAHPEARAYWGRLAAAAGD